MSRFVFGAAVVLGLAAFAALLVLGAEAFDRLVTCAAAPAACEVTAP